MAGGSRASWSAAERQDYFRRLKFTYLEQEAKRNFLFSITGDEPQSVAPGENERLGSQAHVSLSQS